MTSVSQHYPEIRTTRFTQIGPCAVFTHITQKGGIDADD
jgi:hypothetical protein